MAVLSAWDDNRHSRETLKIRTLVIATTVLFFVPLSACGQEKTVPNIAGRPDHGKDVSLDRPHPTAD